jgi:hypothetical protein
MPKKKEKIKDQSVLKKWLKIGIGGAIVPLLAFLITNIDKVEKAHKFVSALFKTAGQCHTLEIVTFPKVPYFLANTLRQGNQEIYWARLKGKNNCGYPLHVKIKFEVINTDIAKATDKEYAFTVGVKEEKNEEIDPFFEFLQDDPNTFLRVRCHIIDWKTNDAIRLDTRTIEVISKDTFCWNLKDPTSKEVPLTFLLATLSAWSLNPDEAMKKRARQFLKEASEGVDPSESSHHWFKSCYSDLFHRPNGLKVHPYSEPWPPIQEGDKSLQRIRNPAQLLNVKHLNSIEAALLISALRNAVSKILKSRLVLYAMPDPEEKDKGRKHFFLSWSTDGKNWRALDVTDPNQMGFEENRGQATSKVKNLLESESGILSALSSSGVFIDEKKTIFALDFDRASKSFRIRGLP